MQFLFPGILYALGLMAVPIIIHLFNFRRYKKIVFSDIRFLKEITEQNKKKQSIRNWLVLACRLLALAFLVFAFAQPFIPNKSQAQKNGEQTLSVYIDNSFSMQNIGKEGVVLEEAKRKAIELVSSFKESDQFQLVTNDFEGKHQRFYNKKDFIQLVNEVKGSPASRTLPEVYKRQQSLCMQMGVKAPSFFWFSDFQEGMMPQSFKKDSTITVSLIGFEGSLNQNVWIDSAWFTEPVLRKGNQNEMTVLVKNGGEQDFLNQPLVLKVDGVQKAIQNINCNANSQSLVKVNFTLPDFNPHALSVSITDYPIVFDDIFYLSASAQEKLKVLVINGNQSNDDVKRVFKLDDFYKVQELGIHEVNFGAFAEKACIIVNEPNAMESGLANELEKYVSDGGVLLFIPANLPTDINSINDFLKASGVSLNQKQTVQASIQKIEDKDPLFNGVFTKVPEISNLPNVFNWWEISVAGNAGRSLIKLNNEHPFLLKTKKGNGMIFTLATSLQLANTNFSRHALFVPFMLNLPLQRKGGYSSNVTLGKQQEFTFPLAGVQKLVTLKSNNFESLIEVYPGNGFAIGKLNEHIKEAGVYDILSEKEALGKIALNYQRLESNQRFLDINTLGNAIPAKIYQNDLIDFRKNLELGQNGTHLWQVCLFLALMFLVLEMLLLKLWKN